MLFGLDVPGRNPDARIRVADYNAVTSADLGRGAPIGQPRPDEIEIAPATLSKYGPETKAALVLTAADVLFVDVERRAREVLRIVGVASDSRPLADAMRVAAWCALMLETYEAQPALFVAVAKARAIQRAAFESWAPWPGEDPVPGNGIEFGQTRAGVNRWREDRSLSPDGLRIFDTLMGEVVAPTAVSGHDLDASNALLVDGVIGRFTTHILRGNIDAGLARVDRSGTSPYVDAYLPSIGFLTAFTETNLHVFGTVAPIGQDAPESFDPRKPDHWHRMMPRIPSTFELAGVDAESRRTVITVLSLLLRLIRAMRETFDSATTTEARRRTRLLAVLSADVLGDDDPLTVWVRMISMVCASSDLRLGPALQDDEVKTSLDAGEVVLECYRTLRKRARPDMTPGQWLGVLDIASPTIGVLMRDLTGPGSASKRAKMGHEINDDWIQAFSDVGVDIMTIPATRLLDHGEGLAVPLHDWTGSAMRLTDDMVTFERALQLSVEVVLPVRRKVAARRGNDKSYRFSLQTLTSGICAGLAVSSPQTRPVLLDRLREVGGSLFLTVRAQQLAGGQETWTESDLNTGIALIKAGVVLTEQDSGGSSELSTDVIDHFVRSTRGAMEQFALPGLPRRNALYNDFVNLERRWATVREQAKHA